MRLGDDLSPRWIWVKGWLFLATGALAAAGILLRHPEWQDALLLAVGTWAFCRFYFFCFHVIEHWVDPGFRFDGLGSFLRYLVRRRRETK